MTTESHIRTYFSPPSESFWQWQDDGATIAWADGKTIAFAEELAPLLANMAPHGLPRFGALLLLLAATRKNWAVDGSEAGVLAGLLSVGVDGRDLAAKQGLELLSQVLAGLHKVRSLDASLRSSLEAKKALVELVFEDHPPVVPAANARQVAAALRPGLLAMLEPHPDSVKVGYGAIMLTKNLAILARGLERVQPEAVRLRMTTGLDALPLPVPLELPVEEELPVCLRARRLINELLDSPEQGGFARIAKRLIASTTLPRKLAHAQQHEVGGYSDIANRGTPDRLLISELAQDDLTLAVRVAMNEAMYLHRETPPSTPHVRREILLDSGVRSWGVPRVLAVATALALAANTPKHATLRAWRGRGATLKEIDVTTRDGLIEQLAALEADPHVADAVPEFSRELSTSPDPVEAIVILPDDALAEEACAQALRLLRAERLFVAAISRAGELRLSEYKPRGEKLIRAVKIELDQLFGTEAPRLIAPEKSRHDLAINRVHPFPLLLPHEVDSELTWSVGSWGVLSITSDGRLMRWTEAGKGAEQICLGLPKGRLWWAAPQCVQGETTFVYGNPNKTSLYRVDLARSTCEATRLQCGDVTGVCRYGALFCLQHGKLREMNETTGEVVRELALPLGLKWRGGRFFSDHYGAWQALAHDGHTARVEPLPPFKTVDDPIVAVWDAEGYEGPIALSQHGRLHGDELASPKLPKCGIRLADCRVKKISPDGLTIMGDYSGDHRAYRPHFKIQLGARSEFIFSVYAAIAEYADVLRPFTLRKKFRSLGVTLAGELALRSHKGALLGIVQKNGLPVLAEIPRASQLVNEQTFEPSDRDQERLRFATAEWPDGSLAVLDSRGLLHLKAADEKIPEVTIVLTEGELTLWSSNGQQFGKPYFFVSGELPNRALPRREVCKSTLGKFVEAMYARA